MYDCHYDDQASLYTLSLEWPIFFIGAGFFVSGIGNVPNNSILVTTSGRIPQLYCLSGSNMSVVGEWISPGGRNLAADRSDPFDIIFGSSTSPGQLLIETPGANPPIMMTHEGVYTCRIPDEYGQTEQLHIGLYLSASKATQTSH